MLGADVDSGDQLSLFTEFDLAPPEDFFADGDAALPKPGQYLITWKRCGSIIQFLPPYSPRASTGQIEEMRL